MDTTTRHSNSISLPQHTAGFKTCRTAARVKMRDAKILRNDARQHQEPEGIPVQAVQQLIWKGILKLRASGLMTNREAANLCLVRFTWTKEQATAKLAELEERNPNRKQ